MSSKIKDILLLNIAVFIIATSAPIGGYVSINPEISIFSRCVFAFIAIGIFTQFKKISLHFNVKKDSPSFILCAILQGFHWVTYFYALRNAGAGLGLIALYTFPIFTTLLEPLLLKTKFNPKHLLLALLVILGLYILTPEFTFGNKTTIGILFGILSAIFYAIRNILMKKHVANYDAVMLMFYQTGFIIILLSPIWFVLDWNAETYVKELPFLIFLGIATTAVGHTLLVKSFANFSATTASLLSCMQPLYGVILAYLFLHEVPTIQTLIGGLFIISAVVLESFISKKN